MTTLIRHTVRALGLATLVVMALWPPAVASATLADSVAVTIDPSTSSVVLGENLDLTVVITNSGAETTPPLVIHLDITDPTQSVSVDPEDWTPELSKNAAPLAPGESVTIDWNIQPISGGMFAVYAVALSPGIDNLASSNILQVTVADHRSLNPGGILPIALATPTLIGALLAVQIRAARRPQPRAITAT